MNIENLKKVRARIASAAPEHCNMLDWNCGGVMCIGGFTDEQMLSEGLTPGTRDKSATAYLGLTREENHALFYTWPDCRECGKSAHMQCEDEHPDMQIPLEGWKQWMLNRLDRIIETGVVEDMEDIDG